MLSKDEDGLTLKKISSRSALLLISVSVLLASSTWFSGTAASPALRKTWNISEVQSSWLTISAQAGFILGTFLYAILNLADIFKARTVFFFSAFLGAVFNAGFALISGGLASAIIFRFLTGVTLAGVYPVGMKLVAQWFRENLGWPLGVLVGALTLGTAVPYLAFAVGADFDWRGLTLPASLFSFAGGLIVRFGIPGGPFLIKTPKFDARAAFRIFKYRDFRLQSFGYFGHMWELYAFWSLAASYLSSSFSRNSGSAPASVSLIAFLTVGIGVFGCVLGGRVSRSIGEKNVAMVSLVASFAFCALSGLLFILPPVFLLPALLAWGVIVIADSPQFSALAAALCPPEYMGTAFTIQNGIGFAVTVVSIQFVSWIAHVVGWQWAFVFLAPGPLLGAVSLYRLKPQEKGRL
jgi:MFS family permease